MTHNAVFVCRPSSALGLEQSGVAANDPAPEPEKVVDVTPSTMTFAEPSVPAENPAPTPIDAAGANVENTLIAEVELDDARRVPETPIGKLSCLPFHTSSSLLVYLLMRKLYDRRPTAAAGS
jgi:hypothetical protein